VIFSDAPYDLDGSEEVVELVLKGNLLRPDGIFIFEHSKKMDFSNYPEFWQLRSYGSVNFRCLGCWMQTILPNCS